MSCWAIEKWTMLRNTPWLKTRNTKIIDNRDIVINRTPRWVPAPGQQSQVWNQLKEQDLEERAYPNHWFCLMRTGGLAMPSQLSVAKYHEDKYDALGSNGECDVRVIDISDLESSD